MKKILLATAMSLMMLGHHAIAADTINCEDAVKEINVVLANKGAPIIINVTDAATVLRSLNNYNSLPSRYITSEEAKKLGWSGQESETLWGLKPTNGKWIGGDAYRNSNLPAAVPWFSADLDVQRGYRSSKQLIYSPTTAQRFISPHKHQRFIEVSPCR